MATFSLKFMAPTKREARWLAERVVFVQGCCAGRKPGIVQQSPMKQTGRMTFSETRRKRIKVPRRHSAGPRLARIFDNSINGNRPRREIGGSTSTCSPSFSKPVPPGNNPGTMLEINWRIIINCRLSKAKLLNCAGGFVIPRMTCGQSHARCLMAIPTDKRRWCYWDRAMPQMDLS